MLIVHVRASMQTHSCCHLSIVTNCGTKEESQRNSYTVRQRKVLNDLKLVACRKATADLVFMEQRGQAVHVELVVVVDFLLRR